MHPVLFRVGRHAVESDSVLYFVGILVLAVYSARVFRRRGWPPEDMLPGLVLTAIAAYVGARLHGALLSWDGTAGELLRHAPLSFFGGLALGSLVWVAYVRWKRIPLAEAANDIAPIAPVLYAFLRLGCFLNGDDYGPPTTLPWGMRFPEGSPPTTERVHPAQLYEITLMVPIFAWLWRRRDAGLPRGSLAFEACILMGAERFLVEFWRLGEPVAAGFTLSQWLALGLVGVGMAGRVVAEGTGR